MNDQNFKNLFTAHKADISDDGFSERVVCRLPERKSLLPQMVMIVAITTGLILTFAMPGFAVSVAEQINSLITSINQSEIPSASSIAVYLGMLALLGTIGFSVAKVDV
jgi:divalent metal cation (Fe/Co/Zn/Cd) transporter